MNLWLADQSQNRIQKMASHKTLKLNGHVTSSVPCNDSKDFNPFYLCRETVGLAFKRGLVVEPSGAAALAAFLTGKVNFKHT